MKRPPITYRRLRPGDGPILSRVGPGAFDHEVRADYTAAFLGSADHEMVVALAGDLVVAMASGVVYYHPDKAAQFWINELATAEGWRRRGIGSQIVAAMIEVAWLRGCDTVWLGTEADNTPALQLYRKAGGREASGLVLFDWGEEDDAP